MLFEVVTIDLHYMTDRQERFDLKISKLKKKLSIHEKERGRKFPS